MVMLNDHGISWENCNRTILWCFSFIHITGRADNLFRNLYASLLLNPVEEVQDWGVAIRHCAITGWCCCEAGDSQCHQPTFHLHHDRASWVSLKFFFKPMAICSQTDIKGNNCWLMWWWVLLWPKHSTFFISSLISVFCQHFGNKQQTIYKGNFSALKRKEWSHCIILKCKATGVTTVLTMQMCFLSLL